MEPRSLRFIPRGKIDDAVRLIHIAQRQLSVLRNAMSFAGLQQLSNIWKYPDGSIIKCSSTFGDETVEILSPERVEEEVKKITEEELVLEQNIIILSSAKNECYGVAVRVSKTACVVGKKVGKIKLPAVFFNETYIDPDYDIKNETCPFIFTLDHLNFIVVVNGGNLYQPVASPRDDWHYNFYVNDPTLEFGQHFLTYYETCTMRMLSESHISYSFSPYTYVSVTTHIRRFIDHAKRLYIPILGRGAVFEKKNPKFANCERLPYGKKPFTLIPASKAFPDGIQTYREVVKIAGVVSLADPEHFTLSIYWPFVPYMHEIPYLNLQRVAGNIYGGIPLMASMQEIASLCRYKLAYNTSKVKAGSNILRTDVAEGSFPEVVSEQSSSSSINLGAGKADGTVIADATQSNSRTTIIQKSASIGTVGQLKDLFVETRLEEQWRYTYDYHMQVDRATNLPAIYYLAEFVDQWNVWPCGGYSDSTTSEETFLIRHTNDILGTQVLKVGAIVIDSGQISMKYEGEESSEVTHNGSASIGKSCELTHIGYTSQQMQINGSQTLTALDENGDPVDGGTWTVDSGGGSITQAGVYIAPATNAECASNPIISLTVNGVVVDTLSLSINAVGGYVQAALGCFDIVLGGTTYHCSRTIYCTGSHPSGGDQVCGADGFFLGYNPCSNLGLNQGLNDMRSAGLKTAGCCPYQLL